jgi:site-specific recombinase XerD
MRLSKLLPQFLDYLEIEKNRSLCTRDNYCFYLNRFIGWAKDPEPREISADLVREYRLWLNRLTDSAGEPLKKNTQNYHLIALRSFLKYLARRDVESLAPDKIELGRMPERQVEFLDARELERLLESPLKDPRGVMAQKLTPIMLRDKAVLEMLFSTGLRVSELAGLLREQVNLDRDEFTVRGKGKKLRVVFLSHQAKYWLGQYLKKRRDVSPFLFVAHDRAQKGRDDALGLTPRSVQRIVERYSRLAGITKKITPHTMRHTFATDLLMNGADIRSVQSLLGHSSITTTQVYTHITNQHLRGIHAEFHAKKRKDEKSYDT